MPDDFQHPEVVTFGEAMGLLVTDPPRPLRSARTFARSICGAEVNVAVGLSRLGHRAGWFGRVGDDPFGLSVLDALRSEGVDVSRAVVDSSAATGLLVRDSHPERRVSVHYWRHESAASNLNPADVDTGYLASARLLHMTGITPALSPACHAAVLAAAEAARSAGVPVSFDPNLRLKLWSAPQAAEVLGPLSGYADVVLAGDTEARRLSGQQERERAAAWFLEQGARLVVVKLGSSGVWATDGTRQWQVPAYRVTAVDAVGAGDAFAAGYLARWLEGADVADCLKYATVVAAMAVQVVGDIEALPYRSEVDAALAGGDDVDR
ncbi:MAG TPA: sugar kinase [Streptosporangiaceae bacterium]|nr:sugar kinase [Streptosporangiaceae bacterium]